MLLLIQISYIVKNILKRNVINNKGNSKIVKCERMLEERTPESEKDFLDEFDKLEDSYFKDILTTHFKYFLPSVVNKLFNREIVNSNYAE